MRHLARNIFVVIVSLLSGCQALFQRDELPAVPYDELPFTVAELYQVADRVHATSRRIRELVRARTALKKVDLLESGRYGTAWRLARVDSVLARIDAERASDWAQEGLSAAEKARSMRPGKVHGHLYYAACAGLLAKSRPTEADRLMNAVVEAASKAAAIDPGYEGGEPRRVLGAIYLYAPSWPSGVGDLDEAIGILEGVATDHPQDPRNLFYLAEAYRRADERPKAVGLYRKMLAAPRAGIWAVEGPTYRAEAKTHLRILDP
ncbi:MAG: hypothetical protein IV100_23230 [Myxococcales bacterium]|nr:hypothetical protein [Myxococcales bacterium]